MRFFSVALLVLRKDFAIELKSYEILSTTLFFAVSCVAETLCAAGDAGGNILTSADPTGSGGFRATNADGSVQITGLSCPTTSDCVAVTNNADVLTSTDPTGGASAWAFENLVPFEAEGTGGSTFVKNALFGASCFDRNSRFSMIRCSRSASNTRS